MALVPIAGTGAAVVGASIARADSVSSISVRGNQRVEAETVRSYVAVKPGRAYSAGDIDESLKALYATGLFSDVKIAREGGSLVVTVVESPVINKIAFEGGKRVTDEQLTTVIESKVRGFLSKSQVQSDVQRLLEVYRRNGRYRATVEPKIIELPQNRVNLVFEIDEGGKTAVQRISFIGNKSFSDGRLRDVIKTRETGFLGWLRSTDTYDPDRLQTDQEAIRRYYMKNGFADMRIVAASAELDRERNEFFVTFSIDEGDRYSFGDIDVQTPLPELNAGRLRSVVESTPGSVYSSEAIDKSMEAIVLEASRTGYAFAQVRPRATRDYTNKTISITYYVEEGQRLYIERINVRGNVRTRDYVIRREFDVAEGDAYNKVLISKAERRLNRLGFFNTAKVSAEQGSTPDRVVINVDVDEKSTGELSFGAGYSTQDGVIGDISLSERNFMGRGQYIKASVSLGQNQSGYEFAFTEPYFLGYRMSAGVGLYQKSYGVTSYRPYTSETTGGSLSFGLPISDNLTFGVGYSIYNQNIGIAQSSLAGVSTAFKNYVDPNGTCAVGTTCTREALYSIPSYSFTYNSLDNTQFPRDGIFAKFSQEFAGAGGDVTFLRTTAEARYYRELWADWGVVGMIRAKGGNITGLGNKVETFDHFFQGGETIRGFASNGIGPRDTTTLNALGGRTYVNATAELTAPLPFVPDEFGLFGSVFADAGTLFDADPKATVGATVSDDATIRSSVGFGVLWRSPFGPLRADFGFPITQGKFDQTQMFRFSGGTNF